MSVLIDKDGKPLSLKIEWIPDAQILKSDRNWNDLKVLTIELESIDGSAVSFTDKTIQIVDNLAKKITDSQVLVKEGSKGVRYYKPLGDDTWQLVP